jgi:OOP family OmpA-OmpF porin
MKRKPSFLVVIIALLVFGANVQPTMALEEIVETETVVNVSMTEEMVQLADNVVILFDSSSSTGELYKDSGLTKLQVAKKLLYQRASAFPDVFPELKVGLYSFTPAASLVPNLKGYEVFYEMQPFNKSTFLQAVNNLPEKASGATLIQNALIRLDGLLEKLTGRTVVFLFTDGNYSKASTASKPIVLAQNLAKKHKVNFQLISTAGSEKQERIIEAVASINESSRVFSLDALLDRPQVYTGAIFVLEESYIIAAENRDEVVGFKLDHILFDFESSDVKVEFTDELKAVGEVLKNNPDSYLVLAGFTDSQGSAEYNLGLSHRRVEAVGKYLAEKFHIDQSRISLFWYGEASPVASNDTVEGRSKNRRVLGFIAGVR